jgi:hypothetical protein
LSWSPSPVLAARLQDAVDAGLTHKPYLGPHEEEKTTKTGAKKKPFLRQLNIIPRCEVNLPLLRLALNALQACCSKDIPVQYVKALPSMLLRIALNNHSNASDDEVQMIILQTLLAAVQKHKECAAYLHKNIQFRSHTARHWKGKSGNSDLRKKCWPISTRQHWDLLCNVQPRHQSLDVTPKPKEEIRCERCADEKAAKEQGKADASKLLMQTKTPQKQLDAKRKDALSARDILKQQVAVLVQSSPDAEKDDKVAEKRKALEKQESVLSKAEEAAQQNRDRITELEERLDQLTKAPATIIGTMEISTWKSEHCPFCHSELNDCNARVCDDIDDVLFSGYDDEDWVFEG